MFIYTNIYIVQKRPSPPIPRPCHAHKVDTSPAIRGGFSNITPKKSAIRRIYFLTGWVGKVNVKYNILIF